VNLDHDRLSERLASLAQACGTPGASLAVFADGRMHTAATGVLNLETGVEATPDSVFRIGSITKVYTAAAAVRLADEGRLDLDRPIVEIVPGFRVADPDVTRRVTARHLLTHTSGISGDFQEDTGPGDDALERFVAACAELGQDVPLGTALSYSNAGFALLGRVIECVTGKVWDEALRDLLLEPLGVQHTATHVEDVLRYRVASGHEAPGPGEPLALYPSAHHARSMAPVGGVLATAADVVAFGRLFLEEGRAADGTSVLGADAVAEMTRPQVATPDRWSSGDHWGLGWQLHHWDGHRILAHDGSINGQDAFLEVVPDARVVIALLTNGGGTVELAETLKRELLRDLCDIEVPPWPQPLFDAPVHPDGLVGRYERLGVGVDIELLDGRFRGTFGLTEPLKSQIPSFKPLVVPLHPSTGGDGVFVGQIKPGDETWFPCVFFELDGECYLHFGSRSQRKIA
jgi:CubicO group peptidase (beta-lactamase class C family)